MRSFEYNGFSTDNIVDKPLMMVQFDATNDIDGQNREILKGEKTLYRQEANDYGAFYSDDTSYEFYLVKKDRSPFSQTEQRKVSKWLMSPQTKKKLTGIADDGETVVYIGTFQSVGIKMITGHIDGIRCVFVCDTPFSWVSKKETFTCSGQRKIAVEIDCDDSEYLIYPKITIDPANLKQTVTITNHTDQENSMKVNCLPNLPVVIDCKYCTVTDGTVSGVIDYEDLGWSDVGNIYWLRLFDGINQLTLDGSFTLTIEYSAPMARIGDFV